MSVKQAVMEIAKKLSDKSTWDDVIYQIHVRQQIASGLKDEAEGRVKSHEEVFAKYGKKKKA